MEVFKSAAASLENGMFFFDGSDRQTNRSAESNYVTAQYNLIYNRNLYLDQKFQRGLHASIFVFLVLTLSMSQLRLPVLICFLLRPQF